MKLEGIHHVSSITGDAQANVDFYVGVLGLRMVKGLLVKLLYPEKSYCQPEPSIRHSY